jgi:hypothetical protein
MRGDDRVRFCDLCSKHVYNLSNLTSAEASALIRENEGNLCMRLYRRRDGTLLTADCPVGLRRAVRRKLIRAASACVLLLAGVQSAIWAYAIGRSARQIPPFPNGPGVTASDWANWAALALGFDFPWLRPQYTMGFVVQIVDPADVTPPAPADLDDVIDEE